MDWHTKSRDDTLRLTDTSEAGLSGAESARRLNAYGFNELPERKGDNVIIRFLRQMSDFMVLTLIAAAAVSLAATIIEGGRDFADPIIIVAILIVNAILGMVQESRAEKAIAALKALNAPEADVLRDGTVKRIPARDLTSGDVVMLRAGVIVPADVRLIETANLKIEESALTGESVPSDKTADRSVGKTAPIGDRVNMAYSGTTVVYGRAKAVVVAIGLETEFGKIAAMVESSSPPATPLQKKLAGTGKTLGIGALIICAVIFLLGVIQQAPLFEMFMTAVSLAVAAIPEGLPAIVTITLAIGVSRMAKRRAIVRNLPAVEILGAADVICSDKTGTLTQNKMTVEDVSDGFVSLNKGSSARSELFKIASLCSDAIVDSVEGEIVVKGEPTERAIVEAALRDGIFKDRLDAEHPRVKEMPFDSSVKLMATAHSVGGGYLIAVKGAPERVLERCSRLYSDGGGEPLTSDMREKLKAGNVKMANRALRVIGVAFKRVDTLSNDLSRDVKDGLTFLGFAGLFDPPRPEAAEAVKLCRQAGIRPVMATGDHADTAIAIARKLGMADAGERALTGTDIDAMTQEELNEKVHLFPVFARVSPEHKVRIVKALQSRGMVTAMTGDGVNDAPALRSADIGCAMGSGTDAAKSAADMVLADDNFATIVEAVREGRGIYDNIRRAARFLLSSNIGEILTIFVAIACGWITPLLPIHLLWVNLVTDSLPAIALGLEKTGDGVMSRPPRKDAGKGSLFSGKTGVQIGIEGVMIGALALTAFRVGTAYYGVDAARTMCFATLSISQLFHAFNTRSDGSLFSLNIFGNIYLIGALFAGVLLQTSVIMIPALAASFKVAALTPAAWGIVALLSVAPIAVVEVEKRLLK